MGEFPNKETQFKPGQSGNPKGRPKGTGITDRLRELVMGDDESAKETREKLVNAAVGAAEDGDHRFWKEIVDRLEGPVKNRTELTGENGGPLPVVFEIVDSRKGEDDSGDTG